MEKILSFLELLSVLYLYIVFVEKAVHWQHFHFGGDRELGRVVWRKIVENERQFQAI